MCLSKCIRKLIKPNVSKHYVFEVNHQIDNIDDELPEYNILDNPPPYYEKPNYNESIKESEPIDVEQFIKNNMQSINSIGYYVLNENSPLPAQIIRYLVKNRSTNKDIVVYLIKNNNNTVKIEKNTHILNNNKLFLIASSKFNIYINDDMFNFSEHKDGVFSAIYIKNNKWMGNAIFYRCFFNNKNTSKINKFIKLF